MRSQPGARLCASSRRSVLRLGRACLASLALVAVGPVRAAGPERPEEAGTGGQDPHGGDPLLGEGVLGVVVDMDGAPLAGVLVLASPAGPGAGPIPELAVLTDVAGRFRWPLRPGAYRLDAVSQGATIASERVRVGRGRISTARLTVQARK